MKLISLGIKGIYKEFFVKPSKGCLPNKPTGGLWSSPFTPDEDFVSPWAMASEDMGLSKKCNFGTIFTLKEDARIFKVDCAEDADALYNKYPSSTYSKLLMGFDWEKISQDWDCIYLTDRGESLTRFSNPISFYGWDCETVLVLNIDVIEEQELWEEKR